MACPQSHFCSNARSQDPLHRPRLESSLAVGHHVFATLRPISNEESRLPEAVELSKSALQGNPPKMDALAELKTEHLGLLPTEAFIRGFAVLPHEVLLMSTEAYSTINGNIFEVPLMSTPTLVSKALFMTLSCPCTSLIPPSQ